MIKDNDIWLGGGGDDPMLDVTEVAQEFNICTRGVWRAVERGELSQPVRIGRCCRWFQADVLAVKRRLLEQRDKVRR